MKQAVFSKADAEASIVKMANEEYLIGGLLENESHLNVDKVFEMEKTSEVE